MTTTPGPSVTSAAPARGPLSGALVTLAGTPDDASLIGRQLVRVAALAADLVAPVSYASVTAVRDDAFTTVATSSELALAVDLAQYADQAGPCLDALTTGTPVGVRDIATTMAWPRFRDAAFGLGLRASLSIPLFAGSGEPIAVLNLYGHDAAAMAPLTAQVWAVYDADPAPSDSRVPRALDRGGAQLVSGLTEAFAIRAGIQRALGVLMAREHGGPDEAYAALRLRAAAAGADLAATAAAVVAEDNRGPLNTDG